MDSYPYGTLGGRSTEELFTLVYSLIDRFLFAHEQQCGPFRKNRNGAKLKMSDSDVLTVVIVGELKQLPSERAWYHELSTTYAHIFPDLLSRSRLVRRRISLAPILEAFRKKLLEYLGFDDEPERFIDSKPVILAHYGRARRNLNKRFRPRWLRDKHSNLTVEVEPGFADIGKCATKGEYYFGMKLHMLTTFGGIPTAWALSAATIGDRRMVTELVNSDSRSQRGFPLVLWSDNGYEGEELERELEPRGHRIYAFPKKAKCGKWPKELIAFQKKGVT